MKRHVRVPIRSFEELSKVKDYDDYQGNEHLILDYDDLSYIRVMKLFKPIFNDISLEQTEFLKEIKPDDFYDRNDKEKKEPLISSKEIKDKIIAPFHLRFYLPKNIMLRRENKIKRLIVMFNGMDEKDDFLLYDTLGEHFTKQGYAAVIIPAQLHLNRRIGFEKDGQKKYLAATQVARNEGHPGVGEKNNYKLFYWHFKKSWFELQELLKRINNIGNFWEEEDRLEDLSKFKEYINLLIVENDKINETIKEKIAKCLNLVADSNLNGETKKDEIKADRIKRIKAVEDKMKDGKGKEELIKGLQESINYYYSEKSFYQTYFGSARKRRGDTSKDNKDNSVDITLLGYSLGGLRALSFFLNDTLIEEKSKEPTLMSRFHSCVTINTCPDLRCAHTGSVGISEEDWRKLLMEPLNIFIKGENSRKTKYGIEQRYEKTLDEVFEKIYFPEERMDQEGKIRESKDILERYDMGKLVEARLRKNINKYIAVASGSDDVVESNQIDKIAPEHKAIHKIGVAGVNHLPVRDSAWQDILPRVENNIVDFIETCNDLHYTKYEILSQLAVLVVGVKEFNDIAAEVKKKETKPEKKTEDFNKTVRKLIPEQEYSLTEYFNSWGKIISSLDNHLLYDFSNEDMAMLLNGIENKHKENMYIPYREETLQKPEAISLSDRFMKYYHLSKSFLPHFAETISVIDNELISKIILLKDDTPLDKKKEPDGKKMISNSLLTFEMIKLFKDKMDESEEGMEFIKKAPSVYPQIFKNCTDFINQLKKEYEHFKDYEKKIIDEFKSKSLEVKQKYDVAVSELYGKQKETTFEKKKYEEITKIMIEMKNDFEREEKGIENSKLLKLKKHGVKILLEKLEKVGVEEEYLRKIVTIN